MLKKRWIKPVLENLDITYTLGGGGWGDQEQNAYDGKWYDEGQYKTKEEILEVLKGYGGTIKFS